MVLLGCTPKGRHTEQHDIFFGIGNSLKDMVPQMEKFWPGVQLHIDAWRTVTNVNGFAVSVLPADKKPANKERQLFFLNLGGYKQNEFEEFHYKMITASATKGDAIKAAIETAFYKHTGLPAPAGSHIDDKYGVDADDIHAIEDILDASYKQQFSIAIAASPNDALPEDEMHLGYAKWSSLK